MYTSPQISLNRALGLLALACLLIFGTLAQAEENVKEEVTLDQIKEHWQQREVKFQSVRVEWTEVVTYKNFPLDHDLFGGPKEPPFGMDVTQTHHWSLLFDQGRWRTSTNGKRSMPGPKGLPDWLYSEKTWVSDGNDFRDFSYNGPPTLDPPHNQLTISESTIVSFSPLARALNLDISDLNSLEAFEITDTVKQGGEEFLVLSRPLPAQAVLVAELWLEARPPYLLRETKQQFRNAEGARESQVEVVYTYTQDPENGWHPNGWTYRSGFPDIDAQVTSIVVDPVVQDVDFTLVPPPLTMVLDVTQGPQSYIQSFIKEDGSERIFTLEELRAGRTIREWLEVDDAQKKNEKSGE